MLWMFDEPGSGETSSAAASRAAQTPLNRNVGVIERILQNVIDVEIPPEANVSTSACNLKSFNMFATLSKVTVKII